MQRFVSAKRIFPSYMPHSPYMPKGDMYNTEENFQKFKRQMEKLKEELAGRVLKTLYEIGYPKPENYESSIFLLAPSREVWQEKTREKWGIPKTLFDNIVDTKILTNQWGLVKKVGNFDGQSFYRITDSGRLYIGKTLYRLL